MKKIIRMLLGLASAQAAADEALPANHRQLVLVVAADWKATAGRLQRFERVDNKKWAPVGVAVPVVVGRTGLAWGRGQHPAHPDGEPVKREGDSTRVKVSDWQSSERMRRKDELYRWGVVVDHNTDSPTPGAGSCVFLHIWRNPASRTVGCTGLAPGATGQLIARLDASRAPVLVQLPRQVYERASVAWQLPGMAE